jgi:putative ATP-binding membrane protein
MNDHAQDSAGATQPDGVFEATPAYGQSPLSREPVMRGVAERIAKLREAIDAGGDAFDPWVAARANEELQAVEARAWAGYGVTVAALAGGTGGGKSTLFNAITGLNFADPGELRPTTEEASACVWNADADAVLDMIGVRPSRRIDYHSILTTGKHDLDSLVLLDLPDHDSVQIGNSVLVDQVLPQVDVLIWVLDPQKYADHLIHESYLAAMRERRDHMIVILNQVDTIPESVVDTLLADVKVLLDRDGLGNVPVYPTSALYRIGLEPIRAKLREAVEGTEAVVATAQAELDAIRRRLSVSVGTREPDVRGEALRRVNRSLYEATGAPAVVQSLRQAGYSLGQTAIANADQPAASMVVATRDAWIAHVRSGLPDRWQEAVTEVIPEPERIRRTIGATIRKVETPKVPRFGALALVALGAILGVAGIVCAALGIPVGAPAARIAFGVAGVACAAAGWLFGRRAHISAAEKAALAYGDIAMAALYDSAKKLLVDPVAKVLERHREVRESLQV